MPEDEANIRHYDLIIAGGGMVGASLALALADTSLRIAVLDSQDLTSMAEFAPQSGQFEPRVSAITHASQIFLDTLGVWEGVRARRCSPYTDMHVWDADGTGSIHFAAQDIHAEELGHIVENAVLLAALYDQLAQCASVQLLSSVTLDGVEKTANGVSVQLSGERDITATLLVAADGANSRVRTLAGFNTKEWDYEHHAIVTTVRTQLPHQRTAIQRFMDEGVLAFLPLRAGDGSQEDQHYCSIVWSVLPDIAEAMMAKDDAQFALALQAAIESRLGKIESVAPRFSFPLRQRHATDYVQANIALIGDAAHTIHPLAGQGVNLGFSDAKVLGQEIRRAHDQGLSIGDLRILQRYQRARKGHNLGMMWAMEGFKRLFATQALPIRWLRNVGMSGLDRSATLKQHIMRSAMGVEDEV